MQKQNVRCARVHLVSSVQFKCAIESLAYIVILVALYFEE